MSVTTTMSEVLPAGSRIAGIVTRDSIERLLFVGEDGHIREYRLDSGRWIVNNLSAIVSNSPPAFPASDGLYAIVDSNGIPRIYYRGIDYHIHELRLESGRWQQADLYAHVTNAFPAVLAVEAPAAFLTPDLTLRIVYQAEDNNIHELRLTSQGWQHTNLSAILIEGHPANPVRGRPFAYTSPDGTARVIYRGESNHIHELWLNESGWHHADLSIIVVRGAPVPDAQDNPVAYVAADAIPRVVYFGVDGHLHELRLERELGMAQAGWLHADLHAILADGAPAPRGVGLAAPFVTQGQMPCINWRGDDDRLHLFLLDSIGWIHRDIFSELPGGSATLNLASDPVALISLAEVPQSGSARVARGSTGIARVPGGKPKIYFRSRDGHLHKVHLAADGWHEEDVTAAFQSGRNLLLPPEWAEVTTWSGEISIAQQINRPDLKGTHSAQGTLTLNLSNSTPTWTGIFNYTASCQLTATLSDGTVAYTEKGDASGAIPVTFAIAHPNLSLGALQLHIPTTVVLSDGTTNPGIHGTIVSLNHVWPYSLLPGAISEIGSISSVSLNNGPETISQTVQWSLQPTARAAFKTVKVWLNAFIPRDLPGYTLTVPAGPHAGETMVRGPTPISDCFLTDQRGPSSDIGASSRIHVELETNLFTGIPSPNLPFAKCFPTIELDCEQGDVECNAVGSTARVTATAFLEPDRNGPGAPRLTMRFEAASSNPCVVPSPDIDCLVSVTVDLNADRRTGAISHEGRANLFPAFEMYYSLNNGTPDSIFERMPQLGMTAWNVWDLISSQEPLPPGARTITWPS